MLVLLKIFTRVSMVTAVALATTSQACACILLSILTVGAMGALGPGGGPESFVCVPTAFHAALSLGIVYTFFQILFFVMIKKNLGIAMPAVAAVTFMSNNLAVLITWFLSSVE